MTQLPQPLQRVPRWLLRGAIALALAAYCLALGFIAGRGGLVPTLLLIALPALPIGLGFASRYFRTLVLAIPPAALALPYLQMPTGTYSVLPSSLLLVIGLTAIWVCSMYLHGWHLAPSPLNAPMLTFGAVCVISLGWGLIWRDPGANAIPNFIVVQVGALLTILASLATALMIGNFVNTPGQLRYILGCFLVFGTLMALTQILRVHQSVLNDRGLWGTWLIACAYGLLIAQPGLRWRWRLLLGAIVLLTFYQTMVVNADWLSGWVPSIIAVVAITLLRSWKLTLGLVVLGAVATAISLGFFETVAQENINDGSLERLEIWQQNWRVTSEHWLLGTGPAGYAIYYMSYFPSTARSTHNNYIDILSQFGFVGAGVWLWLMGASLVYGWQTVQRLPGGLLRTVAIIATGGWAAALGSMLLGDWMLPFAYNQGIAGFKYTVYSWVFLGMLISVRQIQAAQAVPRGEP